MQRSTCVYLAVEHVCITRTLVSLLTRKNAHCCPFVFAGMIRPRWNLSCPLLIPKCGRSHALFPVTVAIAAPCMRFLQLVGQQSRSVRVMATEVGKVRRWLVRWAASGHTRVQPSSSTLFAAPPYMRHVYDARFVVALPTPHPTYPASTAL